MGVKEELVKVVSRPYTAFITKPVIIKTINYHRLQFRIVRLYFTFGGKFIKVSGVLLF